MLPFTIDQFLSVFAVYNAAIWPAQIAAYLLGVAAFGLVFAKFAYVNRVIAFLLSIMWLWTGIAYHALFFSAINKAAYFFGALFVLQGLCFLYEGVIRNAMTFAVRRDLSGWIGYAFIAYAMVIYPLLGMAAGHGWPTMPMFGVTPCPVTIFTFGMLLLSTACSRWLLAIPLIWSLIGGSAAFLLGVQQDWLLLFSGVITLLIVRTRPRVYDSGSANSPRAGASDLHETRY